MGKSLRYGNSIVTCGAAMLILSWLCGCAGAGGAKKYRPITEEELEALKERPNVVAKVGNLPEMSRPILLWFMAVKKKRPEDLKLVFSSRIKRKFGEKSWEEIMRNYDREWREKFGKWHISDIYFDSTIRTPDRPHEGMVRVCFQPPGAVRPREKTVPVVKEGKLWFVDTK